jgi:hypothetical protein
MVESELIKIASAKIFGITILSSFSLLALGGIVAWSFWNNSAKHDTNDDKLDNIKIKIDTLTNEKYALSCQILKLKEDLLELKKTTYDKNVSNPDISEQDNSSNNLTTKEFSLQIAQLQEKFTKLQIPNSSKAIFNNSKPLCDSPKIDMLKWVIEDNVKLRNST